MHYGKFALLSAGLLLVATASAHASSITLDFNGLSDGAGSAAIQSYIDGKLPYGSVTVSGAVATDSYNGEDHVVGPVLSCGRRCSAPSSTFLGNTDGATNNNASHNASPDTFLINDNNQPSYPTKHPSNDILLGFSGISIYSISFDLEIFPDIHCPDLHGNDCGGPGNPDMPDFTLLADGTVIETWNAVSPGTTNGSNTRSPADPLGEPGPQLITTSGLLDLDDVKVLDFQDWPSTIGIDNLKIDFGVPVPEPSSLLLFAGSALAALGVFRRRRPSA